jgi:hypothetical protein
LAVAAGPAVAATTAPPSTELRTFVCQHALDPPARAVSVQAVMRPVAQTAKMQMRFDLLRQKPGHAFVVVRGRNLGSWISPQDPTLGQSPGDVWVVNHPVVNLSAPATYRFRVTFRWLGSSGQVLSTAVQSSPNCYQPELRPDLLVRSLSVNPISSGPSAGQTAYTAVIANRGSTAAGSFLVEFTDGDGASQTAQIASIGAHATTKHRFVAAPCSAGSTLTVTVDPANTVDEYDLANNTFTMACPAPAATTSTPASSQPDDATLKTP